MRTSTPTTRPASRLRRSASRAVRLALALALGLVIQASRPAQAVNVPDRTAAGVVWYLGGTNVAGGIDALWRSAFAAWQLPYAQPPVYWYNRWAGDDYATACNSTAAWHDNGFQCSGVIYLDKQYMDRLVATYGDYAVGGFVAHEWGHQVQELLGIPFNGPRTEYHADCLAGIYTRYGYATGRLSGGDYWEFNSWLLSTPSSASHGNPVHRTQWYLYGYQTFDMNACAYALR